MAEQASGNHGLAAHGAAELTSVIVDTYNAELRDKDGFVGDRASRRAFRAILDDWRERVRKNGDDPIGKADSEDISKKKLDAMITEGNPEAGGLVLSAVEEFAQELTTVIRRFMRLKDWKDTQRIVVGGGLRESRIGELAIGRAGVILKAEEYDVELVPIRHDPDDAGLIGCIHLAPPWIFSGHDGILAVDIGGTNIRAGLVGVNTKKDPTLAKSTVVASELWRHADDEPTREAAVEQLAEMLEVLIKRADKDGMQLAPFIGIG